jgi:long-chain acyl-CoA synthetase
VVAGSDAELAETTATAQSIVEPTRWLVHDAPGFEAELAGHDPIDPHGDVDDELPVLQIMTAAFSGRPKGALLTSRGIVSQNVMLGAIGQIRPGTDVYLAAGPMFHIGVLLKTFAILHWGGTNVLVPRVDAEELCRLIEAERCTSAYVFAPTIREMVELNGSKRFDLGSLLDATGGHPPAEVRDAWYGMTSCRPPSGAGVVGYGTTETVGMVTYEDRPPVGTGTFGRPSPLVALRIVDADGGELPPGEVGEIAVRGPQVMAGYLHEPAQDPEGWRITGDLGRREDDGSISVLGPNLDMIKTGYENVYPAEVENVLRSHAAVREVCVIGLPDPEWGQSICAVVEPEGDAPDPSELVEHVRRHIASYKKPRSIVFVEALPRNGPFVDRAAVKEEHGGAWNLPTNAAGA